MQTFKLIAALLDYPDEGLLADLREAIAAQTGGGPAALVASLDSDHLFGAADRETLVRFISGLLGENDVVLTEEYVRCFDMTPEHSLHLTHHLFGDDKNRGPALIDLSEYYRSYGFTHDERELPDYLPLMLEFVSTLSPEEGRIFLADAAKVLTVLADNLDKAESRYAPLIRILENHGSLTRLAA